jgi:uncharacterized protein (TIGR02453 family)
MQYFNKNFVQFFEDLKKNNSTEWFNENRKTYETEVKKPFAAFVDELIFRINKSDPEVRIKASDAITRINKDIRFSKDKTPYNTHVSAIISKYGRKSKEYPGIYLQLGADKISVYGGAYILEKENLYKIRKYIAENPKEFDKTINLADFKKKFGGIQGEKNKVLPPEFKTLVEKQPLIANKSFFFMTELSKKEILSPSLAETLMDLYKSARPVNNILIKAMEQ